MAQRLSLDTEPYAESWSLVKLLDGFAFDRKIRDTGWTFFFMAAETKVMFFGTLGADKIRNAVKRILGKVEQQHFNGLQVTGIVAKRFLGFPFTIVTAHSRHAQASCRLDSPEQREASQQA